MLRLEEGCGSGSGGNSVNSCGIAAMLASAEVGRQAKSASEENHKSAGYCGSEKRGDCKPAGTALAAPAEQPHMVREGIAREEPRFDRDCGALGVGSHGTAS